MKTVLGRREVAAERLLVDDEICREAMSASTTRHAL